ncbi:hypothetical protein GCM10022226_82960 [Sphaerisporangium flaviroseum]|uniref:DUF4760 domain-containing protein n=1 Tax=Sphaerisporangium flaviroseum TaxID=509199 RepID=A0ABP7JKX6_9ACTN
MAVLDTAAIALSGALIGAGAAILSGALTVAATMRIERTRRQETRRSDEARALREHIAGVFAGVFVINHAIAWISWFASRDPDAVDQSMVASFDAETNRAYPGLQSALTLVAAIDLRTYSELKPLVITLYRLWEKARRAMVCLNSGRDQALRTLRECSDQSLEIEFGFPIAMAQIMAMAASTTTDESRKGALSAGDPDTVLPQAPVSAPDPDNKPRPTAPPAE